jgi:hypothetical protein
MNSKTITAFVLGAMAVLFLLFLGCAPITNGKVQSKNFVPEHEIEVDDPDITIYDITIPGGSHWETVPDAWFVTFGKEDEDGKWKERTLQVDQQTYDEYGQGDWISFE